LEKRKEKRIKGVNLNICTHTASKSIIIARNEGEQFLIPFFFLAEIGIFTNIFRLVSKVEVDDPENDAELVPTA